MIVTNRGDGEFREIRDLVARSFSGAERPLDLMLRYEYDHRVLFTRRVIGLASFAIVQDSSIPFIWMLATDPLIRRRGCASTILKEIIEWARAKGSLAVELTVKVDNPAQKLYFDHGFRVIKVLPRYYGEENGLRMRRVL